MAKKVFITADSTCDISAEMRAKLGIEISPLKILLGETEHKDGVDITPDDIYAYYSKTKMTPKTAAVTPIEYTDMFKKYTDEGYAVVHIAFTSKLSSSCQNAMVAASDFDDVYVVDSGHLCGGQALLVFEACRLRDAGASAEEIVKAVEAMRAKVKTSFVIPSLEYLTKGGRCSALTAFGANVLGIKPTIEMEDGALNVGKKYRGKEDAVYEKYYTDKLAQKDKFDFSKKIIFAHSGISEDLRKKYMKVIKNSLPKEADVIEMVAGCTITAHCGPGTLAVLYAEK